MFGLETAEVTDTAKITQLSQLTQQNSGDSPSKIWACMISLLHSHTLLQQLDRRLTMSATLKVLLKCL